MVDTIINTFDKGLHQDSTFILQPDGTYRNMKNGMLISHDGNHYVVELSKGNKVLFSLPHRYTEDETMFDVYPMPIGFISFIDKLVVLFTNSEVSNTVGGYGEIGVIEFTKIGDDFTSTYTPYYHHSNLNFSKYHRIEGFSFAENDNVERIYWTDNFNEPRVFDIANPIFTNYFTPTAGVGDNPLVIGEEYMVLEGVIEHPVLSGNFYGPTDGSGSIISNVFTASSTTYTETTGANTTKVIAYYPLELLDWSPSRMLGEITFNSYGTGNVNCGRKIYFYRIKSTVDGVITTWSYPSEQINVITENSENASIPRNNNYHNIAGAGTTTTFVNSQRSVIITITGIDTNFDTIEVACMEFDQELDTPSRITIISKMSITGESMDIEHTGNTNLGTVTLNDLTLFPANILKVKTLTTDKNFILIANISERDEFQLDLTNVNVSSFEYPMIVHGDLTICTNNLTYDPHPPDIGSSPTAGEILPWSRWLVSDAPDAANRVEYPVASGTYYYTGDVFVGVALNTTATYTGTAQARPCTTKNRYTVSNPLSADFGKRREDAIELKTAFWDYKDPAVASHNVGFWSNEKYRIAFVGFDLKGNPFYAKWITDFTMPDISTKGGLIRDDATGLETIFSINASGIKLDTLDIPEDIMNQMSGFSIMRAERDERIVTQGLVMQVVENSSVAGTYNPISALQKADDLGNTSDAFLLYLCPDKLSGVPFKKAIGVAGDMIEEAGWLSPYDYSGAVYIKSDLDTDNGVSKMFFPDAHDTGNVGPAMRKVDLEVFDGSTFREVNEADVNLPIVSGFFLYTNRMQTATPGPFAETATCAGGPGNITLDNRKAMGCRSFVIRPKTTFKGYGVANGYHEAVNPEKILMNYIKNVDSSMLYGGTSDNAKANTLYIMSGHYQPITQAVKDDTNQGDGTYRFNDIELFGGDCYTCLIDETYAVYNDVFNAGMIRAFAYTMYYPCECNANYYLRRGRTPSRIGVYPGHANGIVFDDGAGNIRLEDYSYNRAYSTEGQVIQYPALPVGFKFTGRFPYRSRFAGPKFPGEALDSFRKFLTNDYKDLDGKLGEINNIRSKDGRVIVWQNHGTSSVPVLERQLLSSTSGAATTIGTGGVIDRFDPITSEFGNQHQFGLTDTEYGYFWFDMRKRALCVMGAGGNLQEISLTKGLQVFFNNEFNEGNITGLSISDIYNTNNSQTILEVPLLGYGITGVYDPRFKMSYLTFKYVKETLVDEDDELVTVEAKDFTIGYCHVLNAIIGFYDFTPAIWHNHNDLILSANDSKNRKYYGANMPETDFIIGDTVRIIGSDDPAEDGEYVCILPVTIDEYPPTDPELAPDFDDSIYWVKTNDQSQIYLQTFNTQYLKFYGQVYNHELEIIVNPKVDEPFTPQNIQVKATGPNFTDVYYSNDDQSASDTNIPATSRNYRWIDKAWFSNVPLDFSTGRLTDYYTKIKFVYKGYVTDPTVSKNINKVTQWIKSWYNSKK